MSLKVWLPLNNDFKNVGLEQNFPNPSFNNLVINNEGPFTKCHKGTAIFHFQNDFLNTNNWSISVWFNKPTAYPTNANAILLCKNTKASTDCQFYLSVVYGTTLNIGLKTSSSLTYPSTFEINKWYHAAATYDGETLKLYFNGELVNSKKISYSLVSTLNFGIGGRATNEGGTSVTGDNFLMNDVRVYDNVLNDIDIKRIYQKKIFDLVPYSGIKNVLFDRSGFCVKRLINTNAKYYSNSISFSNKNQVIRSKGNGFEFSGGTLSAWFYLKTKPSSTQIFYIDGNNKMSCGLYNNATIFITSSSVSSPAYPSDSVIYGSWNHVMITYGTNYAATNLYLNGVKITSNGTNYWTNGNTFLEIGGRAYYEQFFTGRTSCIRVYKDQLTQDDCLKLYNTERSMFLPDEYEELEYIQSTGTQWIDTNYIPNANSKLIVKFKQEQAQTNSTYYPISCVRSDDNKLLFECFIRQANTWAYSVAGNEYVDSLESATNMLNVEMSLTKFAINGNAIRTASTVTVNNTTRKLFLFAYNKDGGPDTTRYMSCNLYSAKIYESDILKMKLIPSKRKSDSVIGLYDTISRQFLTNSGTGSFTGA